MGHEYEHYPTCPPAARFAAIWTGQRWKVWDHRHAVFVPINGHGVTTEDRCREAAKRWNRTGHGDER